MDKKFKKALDKANASIDLLKCGLDTLDEKLVEKFTNDNLKKLYKATEDIEEVYFDLEHRAETPEKIVVKGEINSGELSEETKRQLDKIVFESTPTPDLSLKGVKSSTTKLQEQLVEAFYKTNAGNKILEAMEKAQEAIVASQPKPKFPVLHCSNSPNDFSKGGMKLGKEYVMNKEGRVVAEVPANDHSQKFIQNMKSIREATEELRQSILNNTPMEKEIIGYKLKDEKYKKYAQKLVDTELIGKDSNVLDFNINGSWFIKFREAGVLDLWFEPVYKETKSLPEIEGYEGEDKKNYLKYGCTEVPKSIIQGMSDLGITSFNLMVDGKKIKVSKAQTKQLFDYINKQ